MLSAHTKLDKKFREKINFQNYSSAHVAAISQTEPGKKIEADKWLPFRFIDTWITLSLAREILEEQDSLPILCLADLERSGIMAQCKELMR